MVMRWMNFFRNIRNYIHPAAIQSAAVWTHNMHWGGVLITWPLLWTCDGD